MKDIRTAILVLAAALVASCTHDYDTFEGTAAAGAAGSAGSAGSAGMAGKAGAAGAPADAGEDGVAGSGGSAEAGADVEAETGCDPSQKPCGKACVGLDDTKTGCAAATCDPCSFAHAGAVCTEGACAMTACEGTFDNCNGDATDGCETNISTSKENCGQCGKACGSGLACQQSQCVCTKNPDCNAGSNGTCDNGVCMCGGQKCQPGQQCDAQGDCAP
jgi:hypothetical protein